MSHPPDRPAAGPAPHRGLSRLRLRDVRIRTKLGLILLVPLLATGALATARVADGVARAVETDLVASLAAVTLEASTMAHHLHQERVAAARLVGDPDRDPAVFLAESTRTDAAVSAYRQARASAGGVPAPVEVRLAGVDTHLGELPDLRGQVLGDPPVTVSAVIARYGAITREVQALQEALPGVITDPGLSEQTRAVTAMSAARLHAENAEALAQTTAAGRDLSEQELVGLLSTQAGQQEAFTAFREAADPHQQSIAGAITGASVEFAETGTTALLAGEPDAQTAVAFSGVTDVTRYVEEELQRHLLASATRTHEVVLRQVAVESAAVLVAVLLAVMFVVVLARMLAASLSRLRHHALRVADRELPATVARLADPRALGEDTPAELAAQVQQPAALRSRDEIGQVAQSLTVVQRAAVRIAAEQAALRTSVQAMFLSLARRSQTLVDRMISQLDEIEAHEEDPKRLARMFTLDHLATRMRRNDENLLTLAGADSSPSRTEHALVVDVLRAAQSEVENYDRVEFGAVDTDVSVTAGAVNDVVRLTAELFDNATRFSPPDAPVVCEARRLGDQVIIQIEDRGVGMPAEQVDRVNAWLAAPPAVEATTFRKMGLAVVARLANRHGIRVELRCDPTIGTVAYIALPRSVLHLPPSRRRHRERPPAALPPPAPPHRPRLSAEVVHHAATGRRRAGDHPVAGAAPPQLTASGAAPAAEYTAPETMEIPIFREVEAGWFAGDHQPDLDSHPLTQAAAGRPPPPAPPATIATTPEPARPAAAAPLPQQRRETGDQWHTAADPGWQAAAAAAQPPTAGPTPSGLPRRVPRAQLIPGGVPTGTAPAPPQRRTPEQIRGLLTAYHRGVQRGRGQEPR